MATDFKSIPLIDYGTDIGPLVENGMIQTCLKMSVIVRPSVNIFTLHLFISGREKVCDVPRLIFNSKKIYKCLLSWVVSSRDWQAFVYSSLALFPALIHGSLALWLS